jgi:hypothetical protein
MILGRKDNQLPSQKELRRRCLRPGRKVDLVLATDLARDFIEVRSSLLEDIDAKGRLILDQTLPRLGPSYLGREIEVTFLVRLDDVPGGRWLRVGYRTPVAGLRDNYALGGGLKVDVIMVEGPKELKPYTLRLHFRLRPPPDRDLRLYLLPDRTRVEIEDISGGGVRFAHPRLWRFTPGKGLTLALEEGDTRLVLEGVVVRSGGEERGRDTSFTAVRFEGNPPETMHRLNYLLQELLRHKLAQRSGLAQGRRR